MHPAGSEIPEESGGPPEQCREGAVKKPGLRLPPTRIKSKDRPHRWWEETVVPWPGAKNQPPKPVGVATRPTRLILWILGGAALREPDRKPIGGHIVCLSCPVCF